MLSLQSLASIGELNVQWLLFLKLLYLMFEKWPKQLCLVGKSFFLNDKYTSADVGRWMVPKRNS